MRKVHVDPTPEYVRAVLDYDPETGVLRWRCRPDATKTVNTKYAGKEAGCVAKSTGYREIKIDGVPCLGHRLAFVIMTGVYPDGDLDHEDRNRANNRWKNLRPATRSQNGANAAVQKNNVLGLKGVCVSKKGNYVTYAAHIYVDGKHLYLGCRKTPEEAAALYAEAATKHFGNFARTA